MDDDSTVEEDAEFWRQAEAHLAWRRSLPEARRRELEERDRNLEILWDRL